MRDAVDDPIEMSAIDDLRSLFTQAELDRFLAAAIDDLDHRPRSIADAIARGDIEGARAEAHRLKGGMVYFGRGAFVRLLERVEVAPDHTLSAIAADMVDVAQDLKLAIQALRR